MSNLSRNSTNILKTLDYQVLLIYLVLVFWGWLTIYSASYNYDSAQIFSQSLVSGKQFVWIAISLLAGFVLLIVDSRWYFDIAGFLYVLVMFVLLVTALVAPDIKGSRSWLVLGPIRIQPAEFAKFATALALAKCISKRGFSGKSLRQDFLSFLIILLPMALIVMEKETGSALVYVALLLVLYREGMPGGILLAGVCAVAYFIVGIRFGSQAILGQTSLGLFICLLLVEILTLAIFAWFNAKERPTMKWLALSFLGALLLAALVCQLIRPFDLCYVLLAELAVVFAYIFMGTFKRPLQKAWICLLFLVGSVGFIYATDYVFDHLAPHQQARIQVLLGVIDDPSGVGYNVNQAKISIGSGGFHGKGYLNGTQTKLKYVPEQNTDFIFCTIGEELGFAGALVLIFLYVYLQCRIILMAERQRNRFVRVYGYCVSSIFFFHFLINLGMVLGIMPVIGIPLPFFSYGGSSLLGFTILLFIFLRMDADRFRYN